VDGWASERAAGVSGWVADESGRAEAAEAGRGVPLTFTFVVILTFASISPAVHLHSCSYPPHPCLNGLLITYPSWQALRPLLRPFHTHQMNPESSFASHVTMHTR